MTLDDLPTTGLNSALRLTDAPAPVQAKTPGLSVPLSDSAVATRALLQERLARAQQRLATSATSIPRRPPDSSIPLSLAQEGLWFIDQLEPGKPVYNICQAVRAEGALDVRALEAALNDIIRRHAVLRTNFALQEGRPVQVIAAERQLAVRVVDLEQLPGRTVDSLERLLRDEARKPFDLEHDLLIRALVIRTSATRSAIALTMHHIVSDGWSVGVLFRELATFYRLHTGSAEAALAELPVQFADFAVWERDGLAGSALERLLGFWRQELAGSSGILELPYDYTPPATPSGRGGVEEINIPVGLTRALKELAQREGATLFMTLLAAFDVLLHRWTGQNDFTVGSVVAGRRKPELEPLIGYFVNTVVFRANTAGNPTFAEFLGRVRETSFGVMAHQELPFERLVQELRPDRTANRNPIFQVLFVLQNAPMNPMDLGSVHIEPLDVNTETAKFDLTLSMLEHEGGLRAAVEYNADLFAPASIARLLRSFETLLQAVAANPREKISVLPIVPADELRRMFVEWNATGLAYDRDACIHQLFEAQVRRTPTAVAVSWHGQHWTYEQLNTAADQLALVLRARKVGPDTLVAVYLRRSPQLLVAMLGILKAGGAYVPLDPGYPADRLKLMLEDSAAPVLVTEHSLVRKLPATAPHVIAVDRLDRREIRALDAIETLPQPRAGNLAYVIYTSGSTGRPKGVCVLHRGVTALAAWARQLYSPAELSGVFFSTSACFDVSVFESLVPLCLGGRIVVGENLLDVGSPEVVRENITLVSGVPSAMNEIIRARMLPSSVQTVNLAGEACPQALVDGIYALGHVERVYDVYGPTETTVYSVGGRRVRGGRPTIGRPLPNERAYVLDANLQPVPLGLRGELFIGGDKLARGYLNRPDLTAERFVTAPWSAEERLYRTGDAVRWQSDGTLEYLGRLDRQVKIRGFRIEPGEVEAVLRQFPGVTQCAVVPRDDGQGGKTLAACIVVKPGATLAVEEIRAFLGQRLPAFLVPSTFVMLDRLPLSPNGKVDVRALSFPDAPTRETRRNCVPPRDVIEQKLVGVWEQVLDRLPVGVTDDFFDLGGHSLLAVRMAAQIEKTLGQKVPVSILFRAPTIERLASAIRENGLVAPGSSLVEIQPTGSRKPIYWLHTLGGGAGAGLFTYQKLARLLGPDQPAFGFISPGHMRSTFEGLAEQYVRELRAVQPEGPYHLGGYCFGGVLAYEMARQLAAGGATVGSVILLDSFPPNPPGMPGRLSVEFLAHLLKTTPRWLAEAASNPSELKVRLRKLAHRMSPAKAPAPKAQTLDTPGQRLTDYVDMENYPPDFKAHAEAHWAAMIRYFPQPYPGKLLLFRTERPRLLTYPAEMQWRKLAREVDVHVVSGRHENILEEPQVSEVAARLRPLLKT